MLSASCRRTEPGVMKKLQRLPPAFRKFVHLMIHCGAHYWNCPFADQWLIRQLFWNGVSEEKVARKSENHAAGGE